MKTEWLPIESAPKDGKTSVVLLVNAPMPSVYIGSFCTHAHDRGNTALDHDRKYWRDAYGRFSHPTHWMPLPEPPAEKEKGL